MAFTYHFLLLVFISIPLAECNLTPDYYKISCPDFDKIVREQVHEKQTKHPTTAAAALRLYFHDCFVEGCDASLLISSNAFNKAERDAAPNLSLPGDGFDVMFKIKTALELACPGVVSCADIMTAAVRNLLVMLGGPHYHPLLGRKDGLVSDANRVEINLPGANLSIDENIKKFTDKGFTIQDMVVLLGAHTVGFSNCREFKDKLHDPIYHPKYADALRVLCKNHTEQNNTMSAFNDVMTPGKFDNMYFQNLPKGLGLLPVDYALLKDPRTKPFVELYASNESAFFTDFSNAMIKLGNFGVKTDLKDGEVRRRCDAFNNIRT